MILKSIKPDWQFMKAFSRLFLVVGVAVNIGTVQAKADADLAASGYRALFTGEKPVIDGYLNEAFWLQASWYPIDFLMLGKVPDKEDFQGSFALAWDADRLYLSAKIIDDVLMDKHADPLVSYWDDDTLEIFIDEDFSGGDHQYNYNAFAYHLALDNQVVDIGTKGNAQLYNEHVSNRWRRQGKYIIWEAEIRVYNDSYRDDRADNPLVKLVKNKRLGFMLAYCDNDSSREREHFIGSQQILGADKNLGWKNADVFAPLILVR